MVEDIAKRVSRRLSSMLPKDLGVDIIGVEEYMKGLRPYLEMKSKVRMIGIYGVKGIGKPTIANYIYEQHKQQFSRHHSFLESIVDVVKVPKDLLKLQQKLISDVLGEQNVELSNTEHGARYIKSRLENLKVLLVLDDVNDGEQIHYLAREARLFGSGSLIIITTRDKSFLRSYGVNSVYDVVFLDDEKALQLLKETAFKGESTPPLDDFYIDLLHRIFRLAQGLPSTLKAYGLRLRGKSLVEWQDALRSFEKVAHENVMRILKVRYGSLDEFGTSIFLHVACLFNGDYVRRVMPFFDQGVIGMSALV